MFENVYKLSPVWLQNVMVSGKGYIIKRRRYGTDFPNILNDILLRSRMTDSELEKYKEEKLRSFLSIAYGSQFWKNQIDAYNVDIYSKDLLQEIKKLPILTKEQVKTNVQNIKVKAFKESDLAEVRTSGSTGNALIFYQHKFAEKYKWATWWRYRKWNGIEFGSRAGIFMGKPVVPINSNKPPFYRINKSENQIRFSVYHINENTIDDYVKGLVKNNVQWIGGYASAISLLAHLMIKKGYTPVKSIKIVTTGSENLSEVQRNIIKKAFQVPVRQNYGLAEAVANISECELGKLHVDEDYSLVEFVPIENGGNFYKIIGTNWTNPAFPLIRYDTGDIAALAPEKCLCGKPGRIVDYIDGRMDDYVVLPDGRKIGRLSHIFKQTPAIVEGQIYQPDIYNIIIRVVKTEKYDENNEERILLHQARKWLGNQLKIKIEYVESIQKTSMGKLRLVISEVTD